jgi:hypothetical protein
MTMTNGQIYAVGLMICAGLIAIVYGIDWSLNGELSQEGFICLMVEVFVFFIFLYVLMKESRRL